MRMMVGSIGDWPKLVKQAYDNLVPGGWLESQEVLTHAYCDDGTLPADCNWKKWEKLYVDAARSFGRPIDIALELKGWYEDAGFVDVVEDVVKCPLGNWPADRGQKENGRYLRTSLSEGLQALSLAVFTRVLQWKPDEVEALIALCRNDLNNRSYHGYFKFYFVRGRKPFPKPIQGPAPKPAQVPQRQMYDDFDFRSSTDTLGSTSASGSGSTATMGERVFAEYCGPPDFPPTDYSGVESGSESYPTTDTPTDRRSIDIPSVGLAPTDHQLAQRRSMDFNFTEREVTEPQTREAPPSGLAPIEHPLAERRSMEFTLTDPASTQQHPQPQPMNLPPAPTNPQPTERRSMEHPPMDRRPGGRP
ncbi:hypothetical protein ABW21_db0203964 [Orbilia brochopaga]|nr:hypothetical protein ABW21_db0203964 [Drechslerella brochopaga]